MKSAVAIAIDGVLRREVGYDPIPQGLTLYRVLAPVYNIVLLGDADDPAYAAEVENFCRIEQLREHSRTMYCGSRASSQREDQLIRLRNSGLSLDFVIEPDPDKSAILFELGFNVMHFMHAQYARPQWRPDYGRDVVPWDSLVEREVGLKVAKSRDNRVDS